MALQQDRKVCSGACDNPEFEYDKPADDYYCTLCGERCNYEQGWYLRQDIIWHKPNPMPESVRDRCTKAHEYIFLLSKSKKYYYDQDAILEECSPNTHARISQDLQNQIGSHRANGGKKSNGPMKGG